MIDWAEIVGGPQDGGRVHSIGGEFPNLIYLGPRWLGDGYAAWSRERSERFPNEYGLFLYGGPKYRFVPVEAATNGK